MNAERPPVRTSIRRTLLIAAGLVGFVAVVSGANLFQPFNGDTALFLQGAEAIDRGEKLYVDFWDNKQPGIYYFFFVAGSLFGFDERGVHTLEVIWWCAFALTAFALLRPFFRSALAAALAPVAFVATYAAVASPWISTQVEVLVGFPLLVSVVCSLNIGSRCAVDGSGVSVPDQVGTSTAIRFAASGFSAGIVATFKLIIAPICFLLPGIQLWILLRNGQPGARRRVVLRLGWFLFGFGFLLALVAIVFARNGTLAELAWTTFVFPFKALGQASPAPVGRLGTALVWYLAAIAVWVPLATIGTRRATQDQRQLVSAMWGWVMAGLAVILVQRPSWWTYHMALLFVPMCVLAAIGADSLYRSVAGLVDAPPTENRGARSRAGVALIGVPLVIMLALVVVRRVPTFMQGLRNQEGHRFRELTQNAEYQRSRRIAAVLNVPTAQEGRIYVFGNPLVYLFSNRRQALPVHGWSCNAFLDEQWAALPDQIEENQPAYVFVGPYFAEQILQRNSTVWKVLEEHYRVFTDTADGQWYERLTDANR